MDISNIIIIILLLFALLLFYIFSAEYNLEYDYDDMSHHNDNIKNKIMKHNSDIICLPKDYSFSEKYDDSFIACINEMLDITDGKLSKMKYVIY